AGAARAGLVAGFLAGKARRVLVGIENQVIAVLHGAHELAVVAEVAHIVVGAEFLPSRLDGDLGAKHREPGPQVRPEHDACDRAQRRQRAPAGRACAPAAPCPGTRIVLWRSWRLHSPMYVAYLAMPSGPNTAVVIFRWGL